MKQELFNSAVGRNSQRLYLIALSYTHNSSDAEDVLQNVFLKLWDYKKPFEDNTHMDKWLTCVTVNECKNLLKSPFHRKNQTADDLADSFEFHEERDIDLFRAVMKLSKKKAQ